MGDKREDEKMSFIKKRTRETTTKLLGRKRIKNTKEYNDRASI